jgi:SAM-dependent methyltransferase
MFRIETPIIGGQSCRTERADGAVDGASRGPGGGAGADGRGSLPASGPADAAPVVAAPHGECRSEGMGADRAPDASQDPSGRQPAAPADLPPPPEGAPRGLGAWLDTPPGRYVLEWEQAHLDEAVGDVFGYHAVQCGEPALDSLRANRMPHRVLALRADEPSPDGPCVRLEHFEELPFDGQSLDLLVLPHVLEFAVDPHQVLREADRVLRPEGRLIVTGFNPVSLWGARQVLPRGLAGPFLPREAHFIGLPRLRDWCKLLSFELERARYGCWRPPCRTGLWLERTRFLERAGDRWWPICGAVYLVAATKRVRGMRLIGPAWRRAAPGRAIALPTAQRDALPDEPAR